MTKIKTAMMAVALAAVMSTTACTTTTTAPTVTAAPAFKAVKHHAKKKTVAPCGTDLPATTAPVAAPAAVTK